MRTPFLAVLGQGVVQCRTARLAQRLAKEAAGRFAAQPGGDGPSFDFDGMLTLADTSDPDQHVAFRALPNGEVVRSVRRGSLREFAVA